MSKRLTWEFIVEGWVTSDVQIADGIRKTVDRGASPAYTATATRRRP